MLLHTLTTFLILTMFTTISAFNFPEESNSSPALKRNPSYPEESPTPFESYIDGIISRGIANLTLSVNRHLQNEQKNIIISPLSIMGALALVLLGSLGSTEEEIAQALGITSEADRGLTFHEQLGNMFSKLQRSSEIQLHIANGIFVQEDFSVRQAYKGICESLYKSEILNLDFKTRPWQTQDAINAWVAEKTNSKIKNILEDIPPTYTKLIIANALYFKAKWEFPFFDGATKRRPFYTNGRDNKNQVMVDMMANGGKFPYYKDEHLNCEIVGFPYKGNTSTMYVVMPVNSDIQTLQRLQDSLTPWKLKTMADRTRYTETIILFPKMRLESSVNLKSTFLSLGIHSLFSPLEANLALIADREGDLRPPIRKHSRTSFEDGPIIFSRLKAIDNASVSEGNRLTKRTLDSSESFEYLRQLSKSNGELLKNPGLFADQILHKTFMDITESGTEAAAATSVSLTRGGMKVVFRVDVPFFFFIRDEETGIILFWGTVYRPTPFY